MVARASKDIGASIAKHSRQASVSGSQVCKQRERRRVRGAVNCRRQWTSHVSAGERIQARAGRDTLWRGKAGLWQARPSGQHFGMFEYEPLAAIKPDHFHKQFDLNFLGLLLSTQEAVKLMGDDGGSIVNVSSIVGQRPFPRASVNRPTTAAVDAITISLSMELGPKRVRVNSINPGMVETEGLNHAGFAGGEFQRQIETSTPLGRVAQPKDIATAAVFFASDDAAWVTEQNLILAGGLRH